MSTELRKTAAEVRLLRIPPTIERSTIILEMSQPSTFNLQPCNLQPATVQPARNLQPSTSESEFIREQSVGVLHLNYVTRFDDLARLPGDDAGCRALRIIRDLILPLAVYEQLRAILE